MEWIRHKLERLRRAIFGPRFDPLGWRFERDVWRGRDGAQWTLEAYYLWPGWTWKRRFGWWAAMWRGDAEEWAREQATKRWQIAWRWTDDNNKEWGDYVELPDRPNFRGTRLPDGSIRPDPLWRDTLKLYREQRYGEEAV